MSIFFTNFDIGKFNSPKKFWTLSLSKSWFVIINHLSFPIVCQTGLEPATTWLKVKYSTNWTTDTNWNVGYAPCTPASRPIPLHQYRYQFVRKGFPFYSIFYLSLVVGSVRIELTLTVPQTAVLNHYTNNLVEQGWKESNLYWWFWRPLFCR